MITADYAAAEPRQTAHYCQDPTLIDFFINGDKDIHSFVASKIFTIVNGKETKITKANPKERAIGKSTGLALDYGASAFSLKNILGTSEQEAQKFIDGYWNAFPEKRQFFDRSISRTMKNGYILIDPIIRRKSFITGFEDFIIQKGSGSYDREYYIKRGKIERDSMNYCIQGTSASMMKYALILARKAIKDYDAQLVNVVHDEIVTEARENQAEEVAQIVADCMIQAGKKFCSSVPMEVIPEISSCWTK